MDPVLERLHRGDPRIPEAVAVAARAFWRDPLFSFFARDLLAEYRTHPGFQRSALLGPLAAGEVWAALDADGAVQGVAAWMPPDPPGSARWRAFREGVALAPVFARIPHRRAGWRLFRECDRRHPPVPHWYLAVLGVDPGAQGRGIGGRLLAPMLNRADSAGVPVHLETQKESNVAWYGRFGFTDRGRVDVSGAPPIWLLTRDPR